MPMPYWYNQLYGKGIRNWEFGALRLVPKFTLLQLMVINLLILEIEIRISDLDIPVMECPGLSPIPNLPA